MATNFENFTSGFVVGEDTVGIQAAKITKDTVGVVTEIVDGSGDSIPTVGAVQAALAAEDLVVASAKNAENAAKLNGQEASYYATSDSVTTLAGRVTTAEGNIETLQGYFTDSSAKNAINATSASVAASAAKADALKNDFDLTAENTYGSVSFAGIDGSGNVEGTFTLDVATSLTPTSGSTKAGLAKASDVEDQLAAVEAKIGQIAAFDGPYETTAAITKPYKTNVIYLVGPSGEGEDKYEEYIAKDGELVKIGTTDAHLSNYVQKTDATYTATTAYASDWNTYKPTVTAAVADVDTLKTASANWDTASAWVDANGANVTAHLANTDVHVTTVQKDAWNAASAWVDANSGLVLKSVSTTGPVSGNGTAASPIGLTTSAETALAAVSGKLDKSEAAATYLTKSDASATYATKAAFDTLNDTVNNSTSGLVKKVSDNTNNIATNTTAIAKNATDIEAVSGTVSGMKYYSKVAVKATSDATPVTAEAGSANDTIGLYAGTGITLTTSDVGGKPVVTINANAGEGVDVVGSGAVTVTTATANNVKTFTVNKTADYYDSTDGLIHLF